MQHDTKDCGPTCLRMTSVYYGRKFALTKWKQVSFMTKD